MQNEATDSLPTPARSTKRQRPYLSPSTAEEEGLTMGSRVGDMSEEQLMARLSGLLDLKLANVATREDILQLSSKVERLEEENLNLKEEIRRLKDHEKVTHSKLIDLEGRSRRNNLIFKGLKLTGNFPDCKRVVQQFCAEVLGCSGSQVWVNRAHLLGKSKAIIAHLPSDADVDYIIMQARERLRNTPFLVHRDYPKEIREKRRCLVGVRKEVERIAGKRNSRLYYDHLTLDGSRLTWEDGKLMVGQADGEQKLKAMYKHDFGEFLAKLQQPTTIQNPKTSGTESAAGGATSNIDQQLQQQQTTQSASASAGSTEVV